jgi:mono/diheme cytochrome c family protein
MATLRAGLIVRRFVPVLAAGLLAPACVLAAGPVTESAQSGQHLFIEHCARCHGADATGNGPDAGSLKPPPANLTQITKRAGGTFPAARVVETITYGGGIAAHSAEAMPVWGKIFSVEGGRGKVGSYYSRRAVIALKRYLASIQE